MAETIEVHDLNRSEILVDYDFNSRGEVYPQDVDDLVDSLKQSPLQSPVCVRPLSEAEQLKYPGKKWKLLYGFRREKAFGMLQRETIPAIVRSTKDEAADREINLTENLQRTNLNKVQEAKALKYFFDNNWSDDMIAMKFGQSKNWVQKRKMILSFPPEVQRLIEGGVMQDGHIVMFGFLPQDKKRAFLDKLRIGAAKLEDLGIKMKKAGKQYRVPKHWFRKGERPEPNQIELMKNTIYSCIGPGLATRCLAWCEGQYTYAEFWAEIRDYCDKNGHEFRPPNGEVAHLLGMTYEESLV